MGTFNYATDEYTSSRPVDKLQFDVNKINEMRAERNKWEV